MTSPLVYAGGATLGVTLYMGGRYLALSFAPETERLHRWVAGVSAASFLMGLARIVHRTALDSTVAVGAVRAEFLAGLLLQWTLLRVLSGLSDKPLPSGHRILDGLTAWVAVLVVATPWIVTPESYIWVDALGSTYHWVILSSAQLVTVPIGLTYFAWSIRALRQSRTLEPLESRLLAIGLAIYVLLGLNDVVLLGAFGFRGVTLFEFGFFFITVAIDMAMNQRMVRTHVELSAEVRRANAELRMANEDLRQLVDETRAVAEARSRFVAIASHELRTPLNGLLGLLELLRKTRLDPQQTRYAATMQRSGDALLNVVNLILDHATMQAERFTYDSHPCDPSALVEEVVERQAGTAEAKGVELVAVLHGNVPARVTLDGNRVKQILENLVSNALKFTQKGGVEVAVDCEKGVLQFSVTDSGMGIPEDQLHFIFDPYTQVHAAGARHPGGTGLGLTISRSIAERMGGTLTATSQLGVGSRFVMTLPATNVEPRKPPTKTRRAILATPSEWQRRALKSQWECLGIPCRTVPMDQLSEALLKESVGSTSSTDYPMVLIDAHPRAAQAMVIEAVGPGWPVISLLRLADDVPDGEGSGVVVVRKPTTRAALAPLPDLLWPRSEVVRAVARPPSTPPLARSRKRRRILIAEDNEVNRLVLKDMLAVLDCDSDFANDGRAALQRFQEGGFYDLILMDIQMPELDGFEASKAMRAYEVQNGRIPTPIVALTAHAELRERQKAAEAGMDDYLVKPVSFDRLRALLVKFEAGSGAPSPTSASQIA